MATVQLGEPPALGPDARYPEYRPWLLWHFFDHLCSYCLLPSGDSLQIDHYEPQAFAPHRVHDPRNLLLGCGRCNGPGGKSDYHPQHGARRIRPNDVTGFRVIDVRTDDLAALFSVAPSGEISARTGEHEARAMWNIAFLKLDLPTGAARRRELQELRDACEDALDFAADTTFDDISRAHARTQLRRLLPMLARRCLFLDVFGLAVSEVLRTELLRELGILRQALATDF